MSDPVIILVRPQLAENIGACARAMLNGGLKQLRLVAPRNGWPQEKAWSVAAGAQSILNEAVVYTNLPKAIEDLHHVYGTCPRQRHMTKMVMTAQGGAVDMHYHQQRGLKSGILFGPERSGLTNEEASYADVMIRYPANPDYNSLNLAQAVMIMAYEWCNCEHTMPSRQLMTHESRIAEKKDVNHFLEHLCQELVSCGFLRNPEKRDTMVRNIRNFFGRGEITTQELQTFRGMVRELAHPHKSN